MGAYLNHVKLAGTNAPLTGTLALGAATAHALHIHIGVAGSTARTGGTPSINGSTTGVAQSGTTQKAAASPEAQSESWHVEGTFTGDVAISVPNAGALSLRVTVTALYADIGTGMTYDTAVVGANATSANPTSGSTTPAQYGSCAVVGVAHGANSFAPTRRTGWQVHVTSGGNWSDAVLVAAQISAAAQTFGFTAGSDDWGLTGSIFNDTYGANALKPTVGVASGVHDSGSINSISVSLTPPSGSRVVVRVAVSRLNSAVGTFTISTTVGTAISFGSPIGEVANTGTYANFARAAAWSGVASDGTARTIQVSWSGAAEAGSAVDIIVEAWENSSGIGASGTWITSSEATSTQAASFTAQATGSVGLAIFTRGDSATPPTKRTDTGMDGVGHYASTATSFAWGCHHLGLTTASEAVTIGASTAASGAGLAFELKAQAGQTATPSPVTATFTATAPTAAVGGVTAEPAPVTSSWAVVTPTVTNAMPAQEATPSPVAASFTVTTPTVSVSGREATPSPVAATMTVPAPTVSVSGLEATPDPVTAAWSAPAPSVSVSGREATPAPVSAAWSATTPTVSVGGVTATPGPATASWSVVEPVVTNAAHGVQEATPAPVATAWSVPAPTVAVGGVVATPSPVVSTWSATTPDVTNAGASQTATPAPVSASFAVPAPTVTVGAVEARPEPVTCSCTATVPTVSVGARTAAPSPVAASFAVPAPVVSVGARTATPAPVALAWTVTAPAVTVGGVVAQPGPAVAAFAIPEPTVTVPLFERAPTYAWADPTETDARASSTLTAADADPTETGASAAPSSTDLWADPTETEASYV